MKSDVENGTLAASADFSRLKLEDADSISDYINRLYKQFKLLWRLFWKEKAGNWQVSLLEVLFPLYPLLFFIFLLEADLFPYERFEYVAVPSYPLLNLDDLSSASVAAWVQDPSLLGFAPKTNLAAMTIAEEACLKLGVNFSLVTLFDGVDSITEARNSLLQAAILFDDDVNGDFTLYHRDFTDLLVAYDAFVGMNGTRDSSLPPLTESEAILASGITKLQAVVDQTVLETKGFGFPEFEINVQMLPDEISVETRNFMEFVFPLMFIGSLFFCMRSLVFGMTLQAEKGIREALELKGMDRRAMWMASLVCYFTSTMITVIVLISLFYATGFLTHVSFGFLLALFSGFAFAQTCFGILMVSIAGDKPNAKSVFVFVIVFFIIFQFIFIIFQSVIIPRDFENSTIRSFFLVYMVPFGHIMALMTEAELLETNLTIGLSDNVFFAYYMLVIDGIVYFLLALAWDAFKMRRKQNSFKANRKPLNSKTEITAEDLPGRGIQVKGLVKEFLVPMDDKDLKSLGWFERNIVQKFKPHKKVLRAVNELTLNVQENEIFCLLGHNGAGKTTTFNTLIGTTPATRGDAWIHGLHITRDREELRRSLGVCPQFDVVMENVKAKDQLIFQAELSGMSHSEAEAEAERLLSALELDMKANEYASNMSGGQKRRLTLALALIGSPAVIVLDEPTTGLDPNNRRRVWKLLQELKKDHTILMTTHSLEEADALADTIAIMADGELQVMGSSLELKRDHGSGYRLTCLRFENQSDYDVSPLLNNIVGFVSGATLISNIGAEVSFALPTSEAEKFPGLFAFLEKEGTDYGIENFGLSPTTLEDVFLNLNVKLHQEEEVDEHEEEEAVDTDVDGAHAGGKHETFLRLEDDCQIDTRTQFKAIMHQTVLNIQRNPLTFGFLIVYPVVFTLIFVYVNRLLEPDLPAPIDITLENRFSGSNLLFSANASQQQLASNLTGSTGIFFNSSIAMYEFLGQNRGQFPGGYAFSNVEQAGNSFNITTTLMFDQSESFSTPVLIQELFRGIATASNETQNRVSYLRWQSDFEANDIFGGGGITYLIAVALAVQGTHFTLSMLTMRKSGAKQMLLLTGLPRWLFWLANFLVHIAIVVIPGIAVYFVLLGYGEAGADDSSWFAFVFLFICFGFPTVLFGYTFSFAFEDEEAAQQFSSETAGVLLLVPWVLVNFVFEDTILWLENLLTVFIPGFGMYRGLALIATASANGTPFSLSDCFVWDKILVQVYLFLLIGGCLYLLIVYAIDSSLLSRFKKSMEDKKLKKLLNSAAVESEKDENKDLENMSYVKNGTLPTPVSAIPKEVDSQDIVTVCEHVNKSFVLNDGSLFQAVSNASLGVERNSIFGLLGPNGAGKTTLIKCITGLDGQVMDSGSARIGGYDVVRQRQKVLPLMGICPQFDALIDLLTPRETLSLFAKIRGVKKENTKPLVQAYLSLLDLVPKADARCKTLSGGNKRRLSVAMSMIGSPRSLFLDEPTTGLDPATRRKVWRFLQLASQNNSEGTGKGILLTTHSMEEADALCSRIAIMVNSAIRTVGTSQQLKTRYGSGTLVTVGIGNASDRAGISNLVENLHSEASCVDESMTNLKYFLPESNTPFSKIFRELLNSKDSLGIVDFAVSQRTLEDVFIEFANLQPSEE